MDEQRSACSRAKRTSPIPVEASDSPPEAARPGHRPPVCRCAENSRRDRNGGVYPQGLCQAMLNVYCIWHLASLMYLALRARQTRDVGVQGSRTDAANNRAEQIGDDKLDPIHGHAEEDAHEVGAESARGVDGGAGGGAEEHDDRAEGEADGEAGPAGGGAGIHGGADDGEDENARADPFDQETLQEAGVDGEGRPAEVADLGGVSAVDDQDGGGASDRADDLADEIADHLG